MKDEKTTCTPCEQNFENQVDEMVSQVEDYSRADHRRKGEEVKEAFGSETTGHGSAAGDDQISGQTSAAGDHGTMGHDRTTGHASGHEHTKGCGCMKGQEQPADTDRRSSADTARTPNTPYGATEQKTNTPNTSQGATDRTSKSPSDHTAGMGHTAGNGSQGRMAGHATGHASGSATGMGSGMGQTIGKDDDPRSGTSGPQSIKNHTDGHH